MYFRQDRSSKTSATAARCAAVTLAALGWGVALHGQDGSPDQVFEAPRFALVNGRLTEVFSPDPSNPVGQVAGPSSAPALGDVDGDGRLDLFVAHEGGLRVFRNQGTRFTPDLVSEAAFAVPVAEFLNGLGVLALPVVALGDFDGDSDLDLAVGGEASAVLLVPLTGSFDPVFAPQVTLAITGSARAHPAFIGGANGSPADLLVLVEDGTVRRYRATGNPLVPYNPLVFEADILGGPVDGATALTVIDTDFDGDEDVVVAGGNGELVEFRSTGLAGDAFARNTGRFGGFGEGLAVRVTLAAGDFDGDGDGDFLLGSEAGGLTLLRDPRLAPPVRLAAEAGFDSVRLTWRSNRRARIGGYHVYRRVGEDPGTAFEQVTPVPLRRPRFLDGDLAPGTYSYRVTAVGAARLIDDPAQPVAVEGPPSDAVVAEVGQVVLSIRPVFARAGSVVDIHVSVENARKLSGEGLLLVIDYNPAVLTPVAQEGVDEETVIKTGLSRGVVFTDNGAVPGNRLEVMGTGGVFGTGSGKLFTLRFKVNANAVEGEIFIAINGAASALFDTDGNALPITVVSGATPAVGTGFELGNVHGVDDDIDQDDLDRLLQLLERASPDPSSQELAAGDLNGDGRLNLGDLVLLRRKLAGLSINLATPGEPNNP